MRIESADLRRSQQHGQEHGGTSMPPFRLSACRALNV